MTCLHVQLNKSMNCIYGLLSWWQYLYPAHKLTDIPFSLSCYPTNLDFSPVWILNTLTTMHTALLSNCDVSNEKLSSHLSSIGNPVWHQPSLLVTVGRDLFVFLINVEHSDQRWTFWSTLNFLINIELSDQRWTFWSTLNRPYSIIWIALLVGCGSILSSDPLKRRKAYEACRELYQIVRGVKLSAVPNCPRC